MTVDPQLAPLVEASNAVDYRLAPEHQFPTGVNDAWAVMQELDATCHYEAMVHTFFQLGPICDAGRVAVTHIANAAKAALA